MSEEQQFTPPCPLHTAVLFLIYKRPDTTKQVFKAIRQAKPPRLYVAADGPKPAVAGEAEKVQQTRDIVLNGVDWDCEVKTLFRDTNLGCKYGVSGGIDWFFEHEEEGIILEDDILPHPDFFSYCETLLDRYATDERIWVITGDNFQNGIQRGSASYYFSRYNHVWGWASWRRAWQKSDMDITFWPEWKQSNSWKELWEDPVARKYWEKIFDRMYRAEIDTWDYPWTASVWYHGGLTATPNVSLVSNIGFGPDATHTASADSALAEMATAGLDELTHPGAIEQDRVADRFVFDHTLGGRNLRWPRVLFTLPMRMLRLVRRVLMR